MMATCPETTVISSRHHRPRGIVSSIVCSGTARLVYNSSSGILKGNLIDDGDNNFGINGDLHHQPTLCDEPSTSLADFLVTDGETGEQYSLLNIPIEFFPYINPITKSCHWHIKISHHAIRFETKDLLIGNRADLEIQQQLGANIGAGDRPCVHVGEMAIKIVTSQKIEPGYRRESICDTCTVPIVEQSEDFLV